MQRASATMGEAPGRVRDRRRSVARRVLAIVSESRTPKTRAAMVRSYRRVMATTRAVVRDASTA